MFSKEVQGNLEKYCSNIIKWNKVYNLLSNSQTEKEIWDRHVLDSTQIFEHIPANSKVIVDFGSGAGFPAVPCAILSQENDESKKFIMCESINKKANFLEDTGRLLGLKNIEVRCERIEAIKDIKADIITARAFAKIHEIFEISENFIQPKTKFILLKGKNLEEEIKLAEKLFLFNYQIVNSKTGDGFIFIAENIKNK
jgi:16S rRNA (guanine527-N7)-methyltransferase